jgi:hypothetical protein
MFSPEIKKIVGVLPAILMASVLALAACQPVMPVTPGAQTPVGATPAVDETATPDADGTPTADADGTPTPGADGTPTADADGTPAADAGQTPTPTAEEEETTQADVPEITISVGADELTFPGEVPAGIVTFVVENVGGPEGTPEIARLNEGVTFEQLMTALGESPDAALPLVSLLGTSEHAVDGRIIYDLAEGDYAAVLFREDGPPLLGNFGTSGRSEAALPEADITAQLVDFAFVIPDQLEAGQSVWEIQNTGQQWHEMVIIQLHEGVTLEDMFEMFAEEPGPEEEFPFDMIAFWSPMGAGERAWVTWDLPAGEYTVICLLPDLAGDMAPHAAHGMVRTLTVTE